MKFISVRDLRTSPAKIWKELPEEKEMVITNNGKPIALLTPVGGENFEEVLNSIRKARAQEALRKMRAISQKIGNDSLSEKDIEKEIERARRG